MVVEFAFANHFLHNNFYNLSHADAEKFLSYSLCFVFEDFRIPFDIHEFLVFSILR